jgi:hypothetical protein
MTILLTKTKAISVMFLTAMIFLTSCAAMNTPGPTIKGIKADPELIIEGLPIFYTITYENTHETDTFYNVTISAEFLDFFELITSNPPAEISQKDGNMYVTWNVGTLKPADIGSLVVKFNADSQIPPEIYQVEIFGNIQGSNSAQTPVVNVGQVIQYIEGRPTPTNVQMETPSPENILPAYTLTLPPSVTPTWTSTPTITVTPTPTPPFQDPKNIPIVVALISVIGVIGGGAIAAYANVHVAKIQTRKKR